ncbi:hypothetical protein V2W45_865638, partial [Cenococcum geophilum]
SLVKTTKAYYSAKNLSLNNLQKPKTNLSYYLIKSTKTIIRLSAAHTGKDSIAALAKAPSTTTAALSPTTVSPIDTITAPTPPTYVLKTRLAISSIILYFNNQILSPKIMRAIIILYIGLYNHPNFLTNFLLSPLLAPKSLLAKFPKTYFLTGERDPLVNNTVIFVGRLQQAKRAA